MRFETPNAKLADVCEIRYGKDHKHLNDGNIPAYGSGGLMRMVDKSIHDKKSVLIPRKGTLNNLFLVDPPFWTVDTLFWTDIDTDRVTPEFLYYQLKTMDLASKNVGTAVPSLTTALLNELPIFLPELKVQQQITSPLIAIDKKISINSQINNNLEQQALTIYRELSKSEPTHSLGDLIVEMPKSRIKVGDAKGLTGEYPFFTSGKAVLSYPDALVSGRKIYLNTGGNADVKYYIGDASYSTDTWCIEGKSWATDYLYLALVDLLPEIEQTCFEGSALRHLQKGKLKSIPVYIPSVEERTHFLSTVKVLLEEQSKNIQENKKLSCLRDLLLPKLLSGEIDVSEVEF